MTDKPREIPLTPGLLKSFGQPLWDKLDLESLQPLSAIEGTQDGHRFFIVELRHRDFGWMAGNGRSAVTTFFIVAIPESVPGRVPGWCPADAQVAVDRAFAYLARPGRQIRPGEWRDRIQQTIKLVESLKTDQDAAGQIRVPTYRPVGPGVLSHRITALLALIVGVLVIGYGLANLVGLVDYRTGCLAHSVAPRCLNTQQTYHFAESLRAGGKSLLLGLFALWVAHDSRERARRQLRNGDEALTQR